MSETTKEPTPQSRTNQLSFFVKQKSHKMLEK